MPFLAPLRRSRELAAAVLLLCLGLVWPNGPPPAAAQQSTPVPFGATPQGLQQPSKTPPPLFPESGPPLSGKQRRALLKSNFAKTKGDVQQLYEMTKKLRDDMEKSNADELNLKLVNRAAQIEKLARKIKKESRGF